MDSHCDDPTCENEEAAELSTDELGTEGKYDSSKSIHCYQNQAVSRHSNGDVC